MLHGVCQSAQLISRLEHGQPVDAAVKQLLYTPLQNWCYRCRKCTHLGLRAQTTLRHTLGVKLNGIIGEAEPVVTPEHRKTTESTPRAPPVNTVCHVLTLGEGHIYLSLIHI